MTTITNGDATRTKSRGMTTATGRGAGWIGFAGCLMVIVGAIDAFEGLIAVIRGQYFLLTANQIIVFDMRTWGWIAMAWGAVLVIAGLALLSGATWARWFAIVGIGLNFLAQLGFVGSAQYPLWALVGLSLSVLVLYALIVHWDEAKSSMR